MGLKITPRSAAPPSDGYIRVKPKDLLAMVAELEQKNKRGELKVVEGALALEEAQKNEESFFKSTSGYRPNYSNNNNAPRITFEDPSEAYRGKDRGSFSVDTVQKAYEVVVTGPVGKTPNLTDSQSTADQSRLHDLQDSFAFCGTFIKGYEAQRSKYWREYEALARRLTAKMLTTQGGGAGTGLGGDFIPDMLSGTMVELYRQELMIADSLESMNLPWSPWTLPLEGVDVNAYYVGEGVDDKAGTDSADATPTRTPTTGAVTFLAKKFKVRGMISEEAEEDAIFSMIDYMRKKLVRAQVESLDDALINGDDSSTHIDSDVTAATDHRKAFDGLRLLTAVGATFNVNGTLTATDFLNAIALQGKFAQIPNDTLIIVPPIASVHLLADPLLTTMDKLGPNATLLRGQVAQLWGRPIIMSGKIRRDLNASGAYDASTNDRTLAFLVHRPSFMIGYRRQITVESAKDIITGKTIVVTTMRVDFKRIQPETTTDRNLIGLYNINASATF